MILDEQAELESRILKVCPVVVRQKAGKRELLMFKHPLAGIQIVKGTVEPDDTSYEQAAIRELSEESGLSHVLGTQYLGRWESGYREHIWHFVYCEVNPQPERWTFHTLDDGGHDFQFFWQDLEGKVLADCHPVFLRAMEKIKRLLPVNIA